MASQRDLQEICNSGELSDIKIGGTGAEKSVALKEDLGGERESRDYTPLDVHPAHKKGRVFYDQPNEALSYYNDISDVTINIGQETVVRVRNETAGTLVNGVAVRATGAASPAGIPLVERAQANLFENSRIVGIATHDIENLTDGFVTLVGLVRDVDLTAFNVGDAVYLSDTVPGGLTNDAPDIACRVGMVIDNSVNGTLGVNIENHKVLQTTIAWLTLTNGPSFTVGTAPQLITNYTDYDNVIMTGDPVTGLIQIPVTGVYRITVNFSCSFNSSNQARILTIHLWDQDTNQDVYDFNQSIVRDMATASGSFSIPARAIQAHDLGVRVSSIGSITGFAFDELDFDIQSLHIR